MGRVASVAVLALLVSACAPAISERVQQYNDLGVQNFQKGDFDRARADFQAALALAPNHVSLLYNLGQCYDHLGLSQPAEQYYRLCLQQQPNDADCRHALDALLVQNKRLTEARQMVQEWLAREPKLSAAYAEDGWLFQREGNPSKAIIRYQQAVYFDPHNILALVEMGRIYEEELNYPSRALKLYQTALEYDPNQPDLIKHVNRLRTRGVGPPHPES
ncbi:MAG TPA: tetratricopeptide repeat protein [Gemmataceae bacterium]|nr:tetratricopeptide repeat protein [Gemmataceae bacterium]